jgi:hypothetical protein
MTHTYEIIVDQSAEGSLALVQSLQAESSSMEHQGSGFYLVTGEDRKIRRVVDSSEAVLKADIVQ